MKLTKTKAYYRMKTCTSILMSIFCKFSIHPRGVYGAATFSHYHIVYIVYFLKLFTSFHSFFFSHLYQVFRTPKCEHWVLKPMSLLTNWKKKKKTERRKWNIILDNVSQKTRKFIIYRVSQWFCIFLMTS